MAKYIYSILQTRQMIMYSWGFNKPMALPKNEGLVFRVNGFKHRGYVKVVYCEGKDLFDVFLLNDKKTEIEHIEGVFFDGLIDTIDCAVERTNDYEARVNKEYNL
ncbi:MAG: hypothetical protein ACOCUL_03780 [Bacteroidota bacterium]